MSCRKDKSKQKPCPQPDRAPWIAFWPLQIKETTGKQLGKFNLNTLRESCETLCNFLTHSLTYLHALSLSLSLSLSLARFLWPFDSRRDTLVVTLPAKGALALCCTAIEVCDSHSYIADIAHFSPTIHNLHSSLLCISLGSLSLICLVITSGTDLLLLAFRGLKTKENRGH